MRLALAGALLILATACSKGSTPTTTDASSAASSSSSSSSSSPATADSADTDPDAGVSKWSKDSTEPAELVSTPKRVAWMTYEHGKGGYIFHRGERAKRLPREWFGVGPPRRDISLSDDGARLAVPVPDATAPELMAVTVFEPDTQRMVGRFAVSLKESPGGGGFEGKISADGKYVVWTFTRRACMVTEIATSTLDVDGAKHKKCVGNGT